MCSKKNMKQTRRGFTLVELMIVIAIIGMLAGLVTVNVRSYMARARQNAARQEISTIMGALEHFNNIYKRYPTTDEGLEILTKATDKLPEPLLLGHTGTPVDPWGNPYEYHCPGVNRPYEVITYGADGKSGGEGENKDICSDDLKE